jgi:ketosteroid isomerase-like protein
MTLPVLLLCLSVGCQPQREEVAEEPVVDVEADVDAIRALFAHNASVINSGDLDAWIAQFTEDAIFMPPNLAILRGRDAGREFARPWYEQLDIEFEISVDEIEVHGDWA